MYKFVNFPPCALFIFDWVAENDGQSFTYWSPGSLLASKRNFGTDFSILKRIPKNFQKPIIYAGGAGNYKHLLDAFKKKEIDSISTANLLNFVGDGLQEARKQLIKKNIKLAKWI